MHFVERVIRAGEQLRCYYQQIHGRKRVRTLVLRRAVLSLPVAHSGTDAGTGNVVATSSKTNAGTGL